MSNSFFQSSNSTSQQVSTSTPTDRRIVTGDSSIVIGGDSSTVNLTDQGAVHDSFGFAREAFDSAVGAVVASTQSSLDTVAKSNTQLADAYKTAKAGEQKVLVGVGLIIAGVVAVVAVRGLRA